MEKQDILYILCINYSSTFRSKTQNTIYSGIALVKVNFSIIKKNVWAQLHILLYLFGTFYTEIYSK